ncbi:NAD(P)-binding protein [Sistotremastrum suecicum HHB10207 ss-3]|uniref:NAD(P)-binding protein n=1 Tax=Sistotremastrum suecicum HHB10207 ss-3 TaxID=1314776 RepID=A0A166FSG5_9AGAM|nr:NAD(P)-binding protein [Sistotremastrum suecicum HHB10207 ss-3]
MGTASQLYDQSYPPKTKFTAADVPDLSGKVIIVTGGNAGIGYETVKALLAKNAKVYMACRSQKKAEDAIARLKQETGKEAIFLELDLADMDSVRKSAAEFRSKESKLHVLFNNGGVMVPPIEQVTKQGYDLQFGTNVLGHFLFTKELLPVLLATAQPNIPGGKVRVVNTSSSVSMFFTIDWDSFKDGPARRKLGPRTLYAQSKFANVLVAYELARRYGDMGIVSTALNPGNIKTELQRHMSPIQHWFTNLLLHPTPMGAVTQLWAGTSAEGETMNGKYLIPWARYGETRKESRDPKLAERLWNYLEEQTK